MVLMFIELNSKFSKTTPNLLTTIIPKDHNWFSEKTNSWIYHSKISLLFILDLNPPLPTKLCIFWELNPFPNLLIGDNMELSLKLKTNNNVVLAGLLLLWVPWKVSMLSLMENN